MEDNRRFGQLSNEELDHALAAIVHAERKATDDLIACLDEFDMRRRHLAKGYSTLYAYCVEVLHMGDGAAWRRIRVMNVSRRFPIIREMLLDGRLSLSNVCLVAKHLTLENSLELLDQLTHKSKREAERILAARFPLPSVGTVIVPISESEVEITLRLPVTSMAKLEQIQQLMRHSLPSGDVSVIVDRALDTLLADLLKSRTAVTDKPRPQAVMSPRGRHIPRAVVRAVRARDGNQCTFIGEGGHRCTATAFLQLHHLKPYAVGGTATLDNIQLRCAAHNAYEADVFFGKTG